MSLQNQVILVAVLFLVFASMSFIARGQRLVLTRRLRSHRKRKKPVEDQAFDIDARDQDAADNDDDEAADQVSKGEQIRGRNLKLTLLLMAISLALGIGVAIWSKTS